MNCRGSCHILVRFCVRVAFVFRISAMWFLNCHTPYLSFGNNREHIWKTHSMFEDMQIMPFSYHWHSCSISPIRDVMYLRKEERYNQTITFNPLRSSVACGWYWILKCDTSVIVGFQRNATRFNVFWVCVIVQNENSTSFDYAALWWLDAGREDPFMR